jgi:hypothetical protein
MSANYKTGKCLHCGADYGLHKFETDKCPYGGREALPDQKQIWLDSSFQDEGEWRLFSMAPAIISDLTELINHIETLHSIKHLPILRMIMERSKNNITKAGGEL